MLTQLIKDIALELVLWNGAVNTFGDNPDLINWFQGSLEDINAALEETLNALPVANHFAIQLSSYPQFATIVTQAGFQIEDFSSNPDWLVGQIQRFDWLKKP